MSTPSDKPNPSPDPQGPLLSEFAGDADMAELIDYFISELQERVDSLAEAWREHDVRRLRTLAHQLKGAAGGYGFPIITERAAELESALQCDGMEPESLCAKLESLLNVCRRATQGQ